MKIDFQAEYDGYEVDPETLLCEQADDSYFADKGDVSELYERLLAEHDEQARQQSLNKLISKMGN